MIRPDSFRLALLNRFPHEAKIGVEPDGREKKHVIGFGTCERLMRPLPCLDRESAFLRPFTLPR